MTNSIRISAVNSSDEDKRRADFLCTGSHDEEVINRAIGALVHGGALYLSDGDYYIDAFPYEDNTAVFFGENEDRARVIDMKGETKSKSYNSAYGAVIHVTETAMKSLNGEEGRVFGGTRHKPDAPPDFYTYTYLNDATFENFRVTLCNPFYPVIAFDCLHFGSCYFKRIGIFTDRIIHDRMTHQKPQTPVKGCIGIRSSGGACDGDVGIGYDTVAVSGLHTGFMMVGQDYTIFQNCFACRCCYGYEFHNSAKTITLFNCSDEGNTHLPRFFGSGSITCLDFAIERFNAAFIPDDPDGDDKYAAYEEIPGAWHGEITYNLEGGAFGLKNFWEKGNGMNIRTVNLRHDRISRPASPEYLETYFDVKSNRFLTWTGEQWADALGKPVE